MKNPVAVTVILGSVTRPGRLRRALAEAAARADTAETTLIDLADTPIPFADGSPPDPQTQTVIDAIASADAVILATPIYRGSLTGALKNLLDHVPVAALRDTPTGLVAMGGSAHHYLGAERHLRDVLSFFGALTLPTAVYLQSRDFDEHGAPSDAAAGQLDALFAAAVQLGTERRGGPPLGPDPLAAGF